MYIYITLFWRLSILKIRSLGIITGYFASTIYVGSFLKNENDTDKKKQSKESNTNKNEFI